MNKNIAIMTSILLFQFPNFAITLTSKAQTVSQNSNCEIVPEKDALAGEFSDKQLETIASRITVKVIGDNNGGSGTLLAKKGNTYLVLTNNHVVRGVNSIKLKTVDGKSHTAQIVPNTRFEKFDLALLQFQSHEIYCPRNVENVANFLPDTTMSVTAAGFSGEKGEIVFSHGKIQQISQPLKEGYQIGYTNNIEQGMSGGAIIHSSGMLIGINGRGAYPILNSGYVYQNGSRPSESEIQEMRKLSWGIPIATVLAEVNADILTAYGLPLPKTTASVPEPQLTGWLGDLEQKAKKFTVRIDSTSTGNGSGVIIAKEKNGNTYTYTVLTAEHVVCERDNAKQPCGDFKYEILAPDGKNQYPVDKSTIKREEGVDLAVVKFVSEQNYEVATLANYNPSSYQYMFTAGYPKLGNNSPWRFTIGEIFDKERGLLQSIQSDFKTDSSGKSQTASSLTGGYELVYTSITYGGMSGGPVLDSMGRVIGIHGRAEGEEAIDEKTGDRGSSKETVQLGYSLGIPISTFLGIATRFDVQVQKREIETEPAPQLDRQKVQSIQAAILSTDVSQGNAKASQWIERGNQLWRLSRYQDAVTAFDKAIDLNPSFAYLAHYGKGLALGWSGKYQEAIDALESATKLKPDFVAAWQLLSVVYREFQQPEKGLVAINKAIQLQPDNPILYNEKRGLLQDLKRYQEAEAAINKAIDLNPRAAFYINRGLLYYEQKKWELALANYNKAIEINPQLALAYNNRGNLYYEQKQWELALTDFNKAIDINLQFALAYNNRGNLYYEQKQWELALADYNKAIDINPQFAQVYNSRGTLYDEQKKWELALADYNKAIAINPQLALAYYNRGNLYKEQKKWELALADYNKAIDINPQFADAYNNRGVLYKEQKKWELALADYNKAIAINPQLALAYYNRGNLYKEQKKWELALADYNKAIDINPQYALAYNNRGLLYHDQKQWELALADYNKAIDINPQLALAYNNRGNLYKEQKKWELALADYNKAIDINPQYALAYNNRGLLYHDQKQWELALADYNKAIAINPQDADAYNNRGNLYKEQKQWELALADYNKAIDINPQYALAYNNRGLLYHDQKQWELALADYNKAIAINPQLALAYYNRGNLYDEQKKWELALADYTKAIDINPQFAEAYGNRGLVYAAKGDKPKAIQDLQQAAKLFHAQGKTADYEIAMNLLKDLQK